MDQLSTYEESFQIRSSEVDPNRKVKLQALCDLMQEVAGKHARELNFDISELQKNNMTWVLHRFNVKMDRYPEWRDSITIKTWPSSGDALRAYRDFKIFDEKGSELGRALSYWVLLNVETRRPVRMPEEVLKMAPADIDHLLPIRKNRISIPETVEQSIVFRVRKSDLDLNNHVNNVRYIDWALELLPSGRTVDELDIEFRSESTYGDTIFAGASMNDSGSVHVLRKDQTEEIVAVAKTVSA